MNYKSYKSHQYLLILSLLIKPGIGVTKGDNQYNFIDEERYLNSIRLRAKQNEKKSFLKKSKAPTLENKTPIWSAIQTSFTFPIKDWKVKKYSSEWKNLASRFSGGLSIGHPLTKSAIQSGASREGDLNVNNVSYAASLKFNPIGNWFASGAVIEYKNKALQKPWNPDFVYTFGYSDWRPYTVSLVYANYGGNRLNPNRTVGEKGTIFKQGSWSIGWKFPIPHKYSKIFTFTESGRIGCNFGYSVVPEFFDAATSKLKKWKRTGSFGCKYTISGPWYVNMTGFYYFDKKQQQPWNPDFTYGFGYFDWRPGTITLQYNNYSGNRWSSKTRAKNTGLFKSGGISIAWSWVFKF